MEPKKKETKSTYWHPAFFADIQIELKEDADNLVFESEHQLSKKPMQIDVLIIKKEKDRPVKKNIGRIFRKYNIVEYKSPGRSLGVDDFYKVYGYTCFYKADVPFADSIPVQELTITFVSEQYPRKLIRHLKAVKKYEVEMVEAGIYSVKGDVIPIQIIVTQKLSETENLWLKSLTNHLKETEDARRLVEDYLKNTENNLYQAVMNTIMQANQKTFEEVNGMSDIVMEIVQEKFDRKLKEETEKAVKKEVEKAVDVAVKKAVKKAVKEAVKEEAEKAKKKVAEETEKMKKKAAMERISLIWKKCAKNKPLSVIADELETDTGDILPIYNTITQNPGKTVEEIYELTAGKGDAH
ncbi:MAG: hypothetical protein HFH15_01830 [Ruminococcus sp.]|nr:hypothetical protein [Ruminococcus sp.]